MVRPCHHRPVAAHALGGAGDRVANGIERGREVAGKRLQLGRACVRRVLEHAAQAGQVAALAVECLPRRGGELL